VADYTNVGKVSDFADGVIKGVEVGEDKVAVVQAGGRWYAFTNSCSHLGIPLSAGVVHGQSVVCVFHNSYFSMTTGAIEHGPAYDPLKIYKVQIDGEDVLIGSSES
jgi:nitrite reductase/ring-hydroxylating ferredoxin subunit